MLKYIVFTLIVIAGVFLINSAKADIMLVDVATLVDNEIKCLADNIYFEARNESKKGQIAVALVTLNRVKSSNYPNNICAVVWQKNYSKRYMKWVAQFSWTLDGLSDKPKNVIAYEKSLRIAEYIMDSKLIGRYIPDFTDGATHYHANYVSPYWKHSLVKLASIDNHIFYRYKK